MRLQGAGETRAGTSEAEDWMKRPAYDNADKHEAPPRPSHTPPHLCVPAYANQCLTHSPCTRSPCNPQNHPPPPQLCALSLRATRSASAKSRAGARQDAPAGSCLCPVQLQLRPKPRPQHSSYVNDTRSSPLLPLAAARATARAPAPAHPATVVTIVLLRMPLFVLQIQLPPCRIQPCP